jgi:hypothetical protein
LRSRLRFFDQPKQALRGSSAARNLGTERS